MLGCASQRHGASCPRSDTWAEQCPAPRPQDLLAVPGWPEGTCPAPTALDAAAAESCLWAGQPGLHQVGQELVPCSPWCEEEANLPPAGLPAAALGMLSPISAPGWQRPEEALGEGLGQLRPSSVGIVPHHKGTRQGQGCDRQGMVTGQEGSGQEGQRPEEQAQQ